MEVDPRNERSDCLLSQLEHFSRRIHAQEAPSGLHLGEDLQFKAAARPQDQHASVFGHALGKQERSHALHVAEAGDLSRWAFCVPGHSLAIIEERSRRRWWRSIAHQRTIGRSSPCSRAQSMAIS